MFGLPTATALLVFGFPLLWTVYTAVFYWRTRHWPTNDGDHDAPGGEGAP